MSGLLLSTPRLPPILFPLRINTHPDSPDPLSRTGLAIVSLPSEDPLRECTTSRSGESLFLLLLAFEFRAPHRLLLIHYPFHRTLISIVHHLRRTLSKNLVKLPRRILQASPSKGRSASLGSFTHSPASSRTRYFTRHPTARTWSRSLEDSSDLSLVLCRSGSSLSYRLLSRPSPRHSSPAATSWSVLCLSNPLTSYSILPAHPCIPLPVPPHLLLLPPPTVRSFTTPWLHLRGSSIPSFPTSPAPPALSIRVTIPPRGPKKGCSIGRNGQQLRLRDSEGEGSSRTGVVTSGSGGRI